LETAGLETRTVKVVVEIGHAYMLHTAAPAKAMLAHWCREAQKSLRAADEVSQTHPPHDHHCHGLPRRTK
jgi:DNA-binding IclR family transcriptional regulator